MKNKPLLTVFALAAALTAVSVAHAQYSLNVGAKVEVGTKTTSKGTTTAQGQGTVHATSSSNAGGVSASVQALLNLADRNEGIGPEIREIAQNQKESASTTAQAMAKIESRSSLKTFFIGSDYKNLGTLRSQIAITGNNIEYLKDALTRTASASEKAEIEAQIKVLQAEQVRIDAYINAHQSTFSLFGWFVKLFVK